MATKKRLHQTFDEVQDILDRALVQPDWNENDPSSDAYIRNRTHWEDNGSEAYLSWEGDTITEETVFKVNGVVFTLSGWWPEANTFAWSGEIGGGERQIMIFPTDGYLRAQFNWRPIGTSGIAQFASLDRKILQTPPCDIGIALPGDGVHKLDNKYLDLDSSPTEDSPKPVTSGGVYEALTGKASIRSGSTLYWDSVTYVPKSGEVIIYTDKAQIDGVNIPGVKIGTGNAYVQDLPFVADDLADSLVTHINDTSMHITSEERSRWDNKLNVDDDYAVVNKTLIFNRN